MVLPLCVCVAASKNVRRQEIAELLVRALRNHENEYEEKSAINLSLVLKNNIPIAVPVVFCAACGRSAAAKIAISRNAYRKI